jgi:transcriptional regulator with XRE-family HTH domain
MSLGANIRAAREAQGLSSTDLAEAVHTSVAAVSRWEHGVQSPSVESLARVAAALGTTMDALMHGTPTHRKEA